jgi:hypothetical protein
MTTYQTGNPIGSADPRDLYDNAQNLDELTNSQSKLSHPDRLGVPRKTWHGMEEEFDAAQADRVQRFNLLLANSGYEYLADYAAGIEITEYNQVIRDTVGEFWRVSGSTDLPYTTTGAGLPEGGAFVYAGDAVLRQELADGTAAVSSSTGSGQPIGEALDRRVIYKNTVNELAELSSASLIDGQEAIVQGSRFKYLASSEEWAPQGIISVRAYGATPGADSTSEIQECIDNCTSIAIDGGQFLINGNDPDGPFGRLGLRIPSDRTIYFFGGASLKVIPTEQPGYNALLFPDGTSNVTVYDPHLVGERDEHIGTSGEFGMGIEIYSAKNVRLIRPRIFNFWGDGIYVGQLSESVDPAEGIYVEQMELGNNRRQGVSIISTKGITFNGGVIRDTGGTEPGAGMDFEPNFDYNEMQGVVVNNVKSINNAGTGFIFGFIGFSGAVKHIDVALNNCSDDGSARGAYFLRSELAAGSSGAIVLNRFTTKNSRLGGISGRDWTPDGPRIIINDPVVLNSTTNPAATSATENSAIAVFTTSSFAQAGKKLGNFHIYRPVITTDGSVSTYAPLPINMRDCTFSTIETTPGASYNSSGLVFFSSKEGNRVIYAEELINSTWPGSPSSQTISPISHQNVYHTATDRACTLILPDWDGDQSTPITFRYFGSVSAVFLETASGRDLMSGGLFDNTAELAVADRVKGAEITVKLIQGDWHVINYVGNWV